MQKSKILVREWTSNKDLQILKDVRNEAYGFDVPSTHRLNFSKQIVATCKDTYAVLGGYQITTGLAKPGEYATGRQFNLSHFFQNMPGHKMELSRAFLTADCAPRSAIELWRWIVKYAHNNGIRYLFGSSSVMTEDPARAGNLYMRLLLEGHIDMEIPVFPYHEKPLTYDNELVKVPTLLKNYINAGAFIAGKPAYDKDFRCYDFLTILDLQDLSDSFKKRLLGEKNEVEAKKMA